MQGNVLAVDVVVSLYNQDVEEAFMQNQSDMVRDPVCGMEIKPQDAAATTAYQGPTYYFCRAECRDRFHQSPEQYMKAA